jgi:hypothetical protein
MADFLRGRGVNVQATSVETADMRALEQADHVLLGCWTSGLFVLLQRPRPPWTTFVRSLPTLKAKIGLFTTYKVATGPMLEKMAACLGDNAAAVTLTLKARSGRLTDEHRSALDAFIDG